MRLCDLGQFGEEGEEERAGGVHGELELRMEGGATPARGWPQQQFDSSPSRKITCGSFHPVRLQLVKIEKQRKKRKRETEKQVSDRESASSHFRHIPGGATLVRKIQQLVVMGTAIVP